MEARSSPCTSRLGSGANTPFVIRLLTGGSRVLPPKIGMAGGNILQHPREALPGWVWPRKSNAFLTNQRDGTVASEAGLLGQTRKE